MKFLSRGVAVLLAAIILLLSSVVVQAEGNVELLNDANLICEYFEAVNQNNYEIQLYLSGGSYKEEMETFFQNERNVINNVGVHVVDSVRGVEVMADITNDMGMDFLEDIQEGKIYLVRCDMEVKESSEFFFEGINYVMIVCGRDGSERKIMDYRLPLPATVEKYETNVNYLTGYLNARFPEASEGISARLTGTVSCNGILPSSIKVLCWMYGDGSVQTVNFKQYCKVVAASEVFYENRPTEWHKACVLAVRNYAWYHYLTARASLGYHVTDTNETNNKMYSSYQIYNPREKDPADYPNISSAVDNIWSVQMLNSDGDLFCSWFHTSSGTQNGGRLSQSGAYSLANGGYNFAEILHYYYDNSDRSSGEIQIYCKYSHSSTVKNSNAAYHWDECTKCHTAMDKEAHSWTKGSGRYYSCTVCGYRTLNPVYPASIYQLEYN